MTADVVLTYAEDDDVQCESAPWHGSRDGRLEVTTEAFTLDGVRLGPLTAWRDAGTNGERIKLVFYEETAYGEVVGSITFDPIGRYYL
jgi:hypothetical protein